MKSTEKEETKMQKKKEKGMSLNFKITLPVALMIAMMITAVCLIGYSVSSKALNKSYTEQLATVNHEMGAISNPGFL